MLGYSNAYFAYPPWRNCHKETERCSNWCLGSVACQPLRQRGRRKQEQGILCGYSHPTGYTAHGCGGKRQQKCKAVYVSSSSVVWKILFRFVATTVLY